MEFVNLLEFLNNSRDLYAFEYGTCSKSLVNFLDLLVEDEQFTKKIDLGIIYVSQKTLDKFIVIDGAIRLLSLSLLLHAVCECYKKTSSKNDKAIDTIRKKYLLNDKGTKLHLPKDQQALYEKIINGERLSGREKEQPMFVLLHNFWSQIKQENIQAAKIFKMLQKIALRIVDAESNNIIDLYYILNKEKRSLNQLKLIEAFIAKTGYKSYWDKLLRMYNNSEKDIILFLRDYFITKFNYKKFDENRLYEFYINLYETMTEYFTPEEFFNKVLKSAIAYHQILNVEFDNEEIKNAFIKIKMNNGEDTFAYILNIYEDYLDNIISEATILEIFSTVTEYLKNRKKSQNDVTFNELIEYLNAFITCK